MCVTLFICFCSWLHLNLLTIRRIFTMLSVSTHLSMNTPLSTYKCTIWCLKAMLCLLLLNSVSVCTCSIAQPSADDILGMCITGLLIVTIAASYKMSQRVGIKLGNSTYQNSSQIPSLPHWNEECFGLSFSQIYCSEREK